MLKYIYAPGPATPLPPMGWVPPLPPVVMAVVVGGWWLCKLVANRYVGAQYIVLGITYGCKNVGVWV